MNGETVVSGLITMFGAAIVAWITGKWSTKANRIAAEAAPYAELARRVGEAEREARDRGDQIDELRRAVSRLTFDLSDLRGHVLPIVRWIDRGAQPPIPDIPDALRVALGLDATNNPNSNMHPTGSE